MLRFASQILFFNCDQFILRTIANCAPFVERIFILYSAEPWNAYNKEAPKHFPNRSNPALLKLSPYFEKIQLVEGVWESEEEQREDCRLIAQRQGFDFLIVQDADEFYTAEDYQKNLALMSANPGYEVYQTPWINFWKSVEYALVHRHHMGATNTLYGTCPLFAMNLKMPVRFESRRVPLASKSIFRLPGVCLHVSYVLSDMDLVTKIGTWGHSHQVNKNWFKWKWLAWHPGKRNLNPFTSVEWVRAIPFTGALPVELQNFENPTHVSIELSWVDRLHERVFDFYQALFFQLRTWRAKIRQRK